MIYHYTNNLDPKKLVNAVVLVCAFQVIVLKRSAEKSFKKFSQFQLKSFRDASMGPCTYDLKAFEIIKGLEIAIKLGWYDFKTFDHLEYEYFERVQNGDLNWIIPGKLMAFMGPSGRIRQPGDKLKTTPEDYIKPFEYFGVKHVIRLNKPLYDYDVSLSFFNLSVEIYFSWSRPDRFVFCRWIHTVLRNRRGLLGYRQERERRNRCSLQGRARSYGNSDRNLRHAKIRFPC